MSTYHCWKLFAIIVSCGLSFASVAYGHGDSNGGSSKDLISVALIPNPTIPEVAEAKGTVLVGLTNGVVQLEDLQGFPFNVERNRILPVNVTSITDPRLKGHDGELAATSCEESEGQWHCHVHSYVVWLAELEDGVLAHPIPLGTIYPRTDGTAADRHFSFREGDISGFGANVIIITAEVTFGAMPSLAHSPDGEASMEMTPHGPIVLQATVPQ